MVVLRCRRVAHVESGEERSPDLDEPTDIIRSAILQLEEGHPAPEHLPPTTWVARVCEQESLLAVAVAEHGEEHHEPRDEATWTLLARLAAVGAESIRAAARHHPDARAGGSILEVIDWTLQLIDESANDPESRATRTPQDALIATVALLGGAAAAAIAMDADQRSEPRFSDRASALRLEPDEDPEDAFAEGLFHVADVCRAGIAWALEG